MIQGILLAAGSSRRFGAPKLLQAMHDGVPMMACAAQVFARALPGTLVVLRPGDETLRQLVSSAGLDYLICPHAMRGLGASLACGVAARPRAQAWVVGLADMPWLSVATIVAIRDALLDGTDLVAPYHDGRRGHPVGFAHRYVAELCALDGDRGAQAILARDAAILQRVVVDDPGCVLDVDTYADLNRIDRQKKARSG